MLVEEVVRKRLEPFGQRRIHSSKYFEETRTKDATSGAKNVHDGIARGKELAKPRVDVTWDVNESEDENHEERQEIVAQVLHCGWLKVQSTLLMTEGAM